MSQSLSGTVLEMSYLCLSHGIFDFLPKNGSKLEVQRYKSVRQIAVHGVILIVLDVSVEMVEKTHPIQRRADLLPRKYR